jgi:hypothetical protein
MLRKLWIWLSLGALAVGALIAWGQQGQAGSAQALSIGPVGPVFAAQPLPEAAPHVEPEPERTAKPSAPSPADLDSMPSGPQKYPLDAAALLFLVQSAISGQQASLAADAAMALGRCASAEAEEDLRRARQRTGAQSRAFEISPHAQAWDDENLRMCQALDMYTRAQWLTLIRRGLQQEQTGIAGSILAEFRRAPNAEAVTAEVLPYLRRDALRCDKAALQDLYFIVTYSQKYEITVNERAAYWRVWSNLLDTSSEVEDKSFRLIVRPPKDMGSPSEVQQIVDEISANC